MANQRRGHRTSNAVANGYRQVQELDVLRPVAPGQSRSDGSPQAGSAQVYVMKTGAVSTRHGARSSLTRMTRNRRGSLWSWNPRQGSAGPAEPAKHRLHHNERVQLQSERPSTTPGHVGNPPRPRCQRRPPMVSAPWSLRAGSFGLSLVGKGGPPVPRMNGGRVSVRFRVPGSRSPGGRSVL